MLTPVFGSSFSSAALLCTINASTIVGVVLVEVEGKVVPIIVTSCGIVVVTGGIGTVVPSTTVVVVGATVVVVCSGSVVITGIEVVVVVVVVDTGTSQSFR